MCRAVNDAHRFFFRKESLKQFLSCIHRKGVFVILSPKGILTSNDDKKKSKLASPLYIVIYFPGQQFLFKHEN